MTYEAYKNTTQNKDIRMLLFRNKGQRENYTKAELKTAAEPVVLV